MSLILAEVIFAHAQCAHSISFVSESRRRSANAKDEPHFAYVRMYMCQAFVPVLTQVLQLHAPQSSGGRDVVGMVYLVVRLDCTVTRRRSNQVALRYAHVSQVE